MKNTIVGVDLFCGGGGTSTGLQQACDELGYALELTAINHWDMAIRTHSANHPRAVHMCETLDSVNLRTVIKGKLDILVASPECLHHSNAAGGRPKNEQSRASAWHVVRWAESLTPDTILIENVPEFRSWGPLGSNGKPLKSRRGETFRAFIIALESLGYRVGYDILNAADYGDPTTRKRLFIQAQRGRRQLTWPEPSHGVQSDIRWRAARDIIEWDKPGTSIFSRKRPLKPKTIARIIAGLEKFGGQELQPFLVILRNHADAMSLDSPIPALCASGKHMAVAEPFLLPHRMFDEDGADSIDRPVRTLTAKGGGDFALVQPFILGAGGPARTGDAVRSVDEPLHTVLTRESKAIAQPFIVPQFGERPSQRPRTHDVEDPLPTVTSHGAGALVEPMLMQLTHGGRHYPIDRPVPTVTGARRGETAVIEPMIHKYYKTGICKPVDEPLDTVTTKARFGLVMPIVDGYALDIRFRMLTARELARAQGFPDDYEFHGTKEAVIRQIGNAVPVNLGKALCKAILQ